MKVTPLLTVVALVLVLAGSSSRAQDAKPSDSKPAPKPTQEELEAKFKATLTKATMSGRWCGIKDGKLTPEKEDKYTIVSVNKLGGEAWIIHARIQYGSKDFVAPIPVFVKWAGDTPVITLDNIGLPGGNSYSARVLVYGKTYAGTWSGGDHADHHERKGGRKGVKGKRSRQSSLLPGGGRRFLPSSRVAC